MVVQAKWEGTKLERVTLPTKEMDVAVYYLKQSSLGESKTLVAKEKGMWKAVQLPGQTVSR